MVARAAAPVAVMVPVGLTPPMGLRPYRRPLTDRVAELELAVDLGDRIGSLGWWRGLVTLLLLCVGVVHLGARLEPLPVAARAPATTSQVEAARPLRVEPLALGAGVTAGPAPTRLAVRLAEPPERPRIEVLATLGRRDGVDAALGRAGVGRADVEAVMALLGTQASGLEAGTRFDLVLGRRETKRVPRPLESMIFRAAFDLKLKVARGADGALALTRIPIAVDHTPLRLSGLVGGSLYRAARDAGVPGGVVGELVKALGHSLDLAREVKGGDRWDVVIEHARAATGETRTGDLLYASLDRSKGETVEMLRWAPAGDREQFFLADGASAKRGMIKTPVTGARMTSGFGLRRHPILGYSRLHKGIDFGAPMGAPIVAAAAGKVVFAGRHGGHGLYVKIRHANGMQTAYAHMSRIAVSVGERVGQGQHIGAVGSTGMSTGPHLHYEVYVNGKAVDPRSATLPVGTQLAGAELKRFKAELERMRALGAPAGGEPATETAAREEPGRRG